MSLERLASKLKRKGFDLEQKAGGSIFKWPAPPKEDPMKLAMKLVEPELAGLSASIQNQIAAVTERPLLARIANYFFKLQG